MISVDRVQIRSFETSKTIDGGTVCALRATVINVCCSERYGPTRLMKRSRIAKFDGLIFL